MAGLSTDRRCARPIRLTETVGNSFCKRCLRHQSRLTAPTVSRWMQIPRSSSRNAVSFSVACTAKRFPSLRCASTIQIVAPSRSTTETQPKLHPAFLRLLPMIRSTSSDPPKHKRDVKQGGCQPHAKHQWPNHWQQITVTNRARCECDETTEQFSLPSLSFRLLSLTFHAF